MLFDVLADVERLAPVNALKASFIAYPLVNALHILAIGALVTSVLLMDLRILGLASFVGQGPFLRLMRRTAATAAPIVVLTGLALFSVRAREYAVNPAFQIKLCLLAVAGLNFWLFRRVSGEARGKPHYGIAARSLAALSLALWPGILIAGRFIGFV